MKTCPSPDDLDMVGRAAFQIIRLQIQIKMNVLDSICQAEEEQVAYALYSASCCPVAAGYTIFVR